MNIFSCEHCEHFNGSSLVFQVNVLRENNNASSLFILNAVSAGENNILEENQAGQPRLLVIFNFVSTSSLYI